MSIPQLPINYITLLLILDDVAFLSKSMMKIKYSYHQRYNYTSFNCNFIMQDLPNIFP